MPLYEYSAKDQSGKSLKGTIEAKDRAALLEKLRNENLIILSVAEAAAKKTKMKGGRIGIDDLVVFSRQLATMVDAGIPILGSLDVLTQQAESKAFKDVLARIKSDVEVGQSLSSAFSKHPKVFSTLYISMVKAGETSGMLDEILDRLATYLEKVSALQKKVKSALVYPAVVTCMAIAITILLFVKVIPVFKDIFAGFGAELPVPTMILINISDVFKKYYVAVFIALGIAGFFGKRYINTERGRLKFDQLLLRLPVFGMLIRKVAVSKFTRTLSTLVRSGVPILSSLEVVAKTCGNKVFELAVDKVRMSVREGEQVATPLEASGVFPPMVVKMIAIGEQTGELEKMLGKISDFYDAQVDAAVSGLTSIIEPLIIAFLGIVIGTIVICMFLPIFKISTIINM
ncbi:MAG: type II secretion system F family protein [Candidatus Omnitrophica bacterium]|nr:type II secretion system F family protein [Candidatus Omnitrophota bacterium]